MWWSLTKDRVNEFYRKKDIAGLVRALQYRKDWEVRSSAAFILRGSDLIMGDGVIGQLVAALKDEHRYVRVEALTTLGCAKDPDAPPEVRKAVSEALSTDTLIALLNDPYPGVREKAALQLASTRDSRAIKPLESLLDDDDAEVRAAAITALGRFGVSECAERFLVALQDNNRDIQRAAASALLELGDVRVVTILVNEIAHNGNNSALRGYSSLLVQRFGAVAIEQFLSAMPRVSGVALIDVTRALAQTGEATIVKPLLSRLEFESDFIRTRVLGCLGDLGEAAKREREESLNREYGSPQTCLSCGKKAMRVKAKPASAFGQSLVAVDMFCSECGWSGSAAGPPG